jgi:hypothetical protein
MPDDTFHRSKTNVKFRDYGAAGIAGIYQQAAVYEEIVHKQTGWVVSGEPGSWYEGIMALIEDRALLEHIRQNAQHTVYKHYRLEVAAQDWHDDIAAIATEHPPPLKPLPPQMAAGWLQAVAVGAAQRVYYVLPEETRVAFKRLRWRLHSEAV